jgi:hypothetical protein
MISETANQISCDKCGSIHRPGKCPKENLDNKDNSGGCPVDHHESSGIDSECPIDHTEFINKTDDGEAGLKKGGDYDREIFLEEVRNSDEYSIFFEDLPNDTRERKERIRNLVNKLRKAEKKIDNPNEDMNRGKFTILVNKLKELNGEDGDHFSEDIASEISMQQLQEFNSKLREAFSPLVEDSSQSALELKKMSYIVKILHLL